MSVLLDILNRPRKPWPEHDRAQPEHKPEPPEPEPTALDRLLMAGVPEEWARGVASLYEQPPPRDWPHPQERNWRRTIARAEAILVEHGARLAACGWTTLELFGVHHRQPWRRVEYLGLALMALVEGATVDVAESALTLHRGPFSKPLVFRRPHAKPGQVPVWSLARVAS